MSDPTTYAGDIWNAAFDRVKTLPGFNSFRQSPMLTLQPDKLPCLSVYLLREVMTPDGDANAGEPSFVHNVHLGFSGVVAMSDDAAQLKALDVAMGRISTALFTDPTFVRLIEGFVSLDRKTAFPRIGETPCAEIQIELVVTFRSDWPPAVTDVFEKLGITTTYPDGTPQVRREYDIPQG